MNWLNCFILGIRRLFFCIGLIAGPFTGAITGQVTKERDLDRQAYHCVVSETGSIRLIHNKLSQEVYKFKDDFFLVQTDRGTFSNKQSRPRSVMQTPLSLIYKYAFPGVEIDLVYEAGEGNYLSRHLTIRTSHRLRLQRIVLADTRLISAASETIHYLTFWMAPTVEFVRFELGGLFTGIENPFYKADLSNDHVRLQFDPGLILNAGDTYTSEPQFIGVYKKSGVMIVDSDRPFRYTNGSGHIPIDRNESRAMRQFALSYLVPTQDRFLNINYQFFHPLPQMPHTQGEMKYYENAIQSFSEINGDMIIFRPLYPYTKPDSSRPYWDLLPADQQSVSNKIIGYAKSKGIGIGFYMGIAAHGSEGNAGGLPFRPEKLSWKKLDASGNRSTDNCLGDDAYYEWWFTVQDNTIRKYGLSNWSWDPSIGSAMNCYDEAHGHIAGQGAYKGWRRCIELAGRLKKSNAGLFIQGFYGTKNFGLWGLRNTDQHEVYNEQTAIVSSHHIQWSDDRQNADGLRFQNYWSMRFRFLPAVMGHTLVHRMNEGYFDPELVKAWDYYGWRYALLSSIAVGGSVMPSILPYNTKLVPGFSAFYQKWLQWSRDNFDYVNATEPFGEQVQPGAVDAYARVINDHGFVFLFNGNPRSAAFHFEVGDEINLQQEGQYYFSELYPDENGKRVLDGNGRTHFRRGDTASVVIAANSCMVLELHAVKPADSVVVSGVAGTVLRVKNELFLTVSPGEAGSVHAMKVKLPQARTVKEVFVNGSSQAFTADKSAIDLRFGYAGQKLARELDEWTLVNGDPFLFPFHPSYDSVSLSLLFSASDTIRQLVESVRESGLESMDSIIAGWQRSIEPSYSYHNFIGSRPGRLWLIIPFRRTDSLHLKVFLNDIDITAGIKYDRYATSFFADITDSIKWAAGNRVVLVLNHLSANSFMGPLLIYPDGPLVSLVNNNSNTLFDERIRYTGPLMPASRPRYIKNGNPVRVMNAVVSGNVSPGQLVQLGVQLDRPPSEVEAVWYSQSGFPWMGKVALNYDPATGKWVGDVVPGDRAAIQEHEYIYVWAMGADGLKSEYYPVKIGWSFEPLRTYRNPRSVKPSFLY